MPPLGTMNAPDGVVNSGNAQGGNVGEQHGPPGPMPSHDPFEQDPLINAGKAVWSGVRGLFSAVKGGGGDADSRVPQGGQKDTQAESGFYFDKEKNMWRQRGSNDDADAGEYDYMTGKKLTPAASELKEAAPPPPPPMGAPPAGGSMGMSATTSLGTHRNSASLYVNPLASASPGGAMHAPPSVAAGPPRTAPLANNPGPLASPFGTQEQVVPGGVAPVPLASPFGNQQQPPGVRKSPFG